MICNKFVQIPPREYAIPADHNLNDKDDPTTPNPILVIRVP